MTYITQVNWKTSMFGSRIMMVFLVLGVIAMQAGRAQAQWTTNGNNINNTNTGNVGVGVTNPVTKVHIGGQADNLFQVVSTGSTSSDTVAHFSSAAGSNMIIRGNGNVGLGTTLPLLKLDIGGLGSAIGFAPGNTSGIGTNAVLNRIVARNNFGAVDTSSAAEIKFLTGSAAWQFGQIAFYTNNYDSTQGGYTLERMRITSPGNVGIGTTNPSQKVEAYNASGPTYFKATSGSVGTYLGTDGTNSYLQAVAADQKIFISNSAGTALLTADTGTANVGIGLTNPSEKLEVTGNLKVSGSITGGTIQAKYQDVAEWVESSQSLAAGTVVVLDHTRSNQVIASSKSYDTRVAGVISLQPGIALGESGAGKVLVATTGRVKIKVDATAGPIQIGDLLVTSAVPGLAMKSEPITIRGRQIHSPGTLIGKALEPLKKGTGEILVLLSLQ